MTDDLRTRAEAASLIRAPRHHIFESSNANAHYRAGFMDGFKWHAAQQPTRKQIAEVLVRDLTYSTGLDADENDAIAAVQADAILALLNGAGS